MDNTMQSLGPNGTQRTRQTVHIDFPSAKYKLVDDPSRVTLQRASSPLNPILPKRPTRKTWCSRARERYPLTSGLTGPARAGKYGELVGEKGGRYLGEVLAGRPHGHGQYLLPKAGPGSAYVVQYDGEWVQGRREGSGQRFYHNGEVYSGNWVTNLRHGRGRYHYANGDVYDGEWVADHRTGYGAYCYKNGDVFVGHYMKDKREGLGTLYMISRGKKYVAEYVHDQPKCGTYLEIEDPDLEPLVGALAQQVVIVKVTQEGAGIKTTPLPELDLSQPNKVLAREVVAVRQERREGPKALRGVQAATGTLAAHQVESLRHSFTKLAGGNNPKVGLLPHQLRQLCVMAGLDPAANSTRLLVDQLLASRNSQGRIDFDTFMKRVLHFQELVVDKEQVEPQDALLEYKRQLAEQEAAEQRERDEAAAAEAAEIALAEERERRAIEAALEAERLAAGGGGDGGEDGGEFDGSEYQEQQQQGEEADGMMVAAPEGKRPVFTPVEGVPETARGFTPASDIAAGVGAASPIAKPSSAASSQNGRSGSQNGLDGPGSRLGSAASQVKGISTPPGTPPPAGEERVGSAASGAAAARSGSQNGIGSGSARGSQNGAGSGSARGSQNGLGGDVAAGSNPPSRGGSVAGSVSGAAKASSAVGSPRGGSAAGSAVGSPRASATGGRSAVGSPRPSAPGGGSAVGSPRASAAGGSAVGSPRPAGSPAGSAPGSPRPAGSPAGSARGSVAGSEPGSKIAGSAAGSAPGSARPSVTGSESGKPAVAGSAAGSAMGSRPGSTGSRVMARGESAGGEDGGVSGDVAVGRSSHVEVEGEGVEATDGGEEGGEDGGEEVITLDLVKGVQMPPAPERPDPIEFDGTVEVMGKFDDSELGRTT